MKKLLTYARHKHVVDRYRYWTEVKRLREDDVLKILSYRECFFAERVIYIIIRDFKEDPELELELKKELNFGAQANQGDPKQTKIHFE